MKIIIAISTIILIVSCNKNSTTESINKDDFKTHLYYISTRNYDEIIDTIPYSIGNYTPDSAKLVGLYLFLYGDTLIKHRINKYVDSTYNETSKKYEYNVTYTLDSLGSIYNKNIEYPSFGLLSSNNDSINRLITVSLGHIIINKFMYR